jgi:ribonuclease-3
MTSDKRRRVPAASLEEAFGVPFKPDLLERALTHRSYAYENGGLPTNERLEFLGDSVLGVVITSALFHNHPGAARGQLAKLRASVVNMHALADVARTLGPEGLGPHLLLGKGEESHRRAATRQHPGRHARGAARRHLPAARPGHGGHGDPPALRSADGRIRGPGAALDWKTSLQELTAALGLGVPTTSSTTPARTTPRRSRPGWWWPASATAARTAAARSRRSNARPPPHGARSATGWKPGHPARGCRRRPPGPRRRRVKLVDRHRCPAPEGLWDKAGGLARRRHRGRHPGADPARPDPRAAVARSRRATTAPGCGSRMLVWGRRLVSAGSR